MDAVEAISSALETALAADSGAGGLLNSTGNQYLRGSYVRAGDIRKTENTPFLEYAIVPTERGLEQLTRDVDALVRCTIESDRHLGFAIPNAVEERLITLLTTTAFTASGWTFSTVKIVRPAFQTGETSNRIRHTVESAWSLHK